MFPAGTPVTPRKISRLCGDADQHVHVARPGPLPANGTDQHFRLQLHLELLLGRSPRNLADIPRRFARRYFAQPTLRTNS